MLTSLELIHVSWTPILAWNFFPPYSAIVVVPSVPLWKHVLKKSYCGGNCRNVPPLNQRLQYPTCREVAPSIKPAVVVIHCWTICCMCNSLLSKQVIYIQCPTMELPSMKPVVAVFHRGTICSMCNSLQSKQLLQIQRPAVKSISSLATSLGCKHQLTNWLTNAV